MKTCFCLVVAVALTAVSAHADPATIAKQRAKEVVRENNVRQGIGAPAAATAHPAVPPPQRADPVGKLKADLAAMAGNASVSAELKAQLPHDLLACARGSRKPSTAAVEKFANSLSAALSGKGLTASVQSRLANDINLTFNSASLSAQRTSEVGDDVQAILQTAGLSRAAAVDVVADLKAIAAELQGAR